MDKKATRADEHAEQLKRDRQIILDRIRGYHTHIDGCTAEMSKSMQKQCWKIKPLKFFISIGGRDRVAGGKVDGITES